MTQPLVVILLTYARTRYMQMTVEAARRNLRYAGKILYYVADDGSAPEHMEAVRAELNGAEVLGWHSERIGYGASANKAWFQAHEVTDVTLWLEDDWTMLRECDVTPWIETLERYGDIGMIRLAHLATGLHCDTVGYDGRHYLRMDWGVPYAFSGNPALRHRRAREAWGPYPEGLLPGDTETAYDWQTSQRKGPRILWPVDIGGWGLFGHIGAEKSY